ncbi:hypothetical protein MUP79_07010, partial [Candidatus Bathyarchaeota archaeon]|nr:hypothetical protein [Candidatus Bathyarchaeota archaeon]
MVELREHEYRTLSVLAKLGGKASVDELVTKGGLPDAAVMRAVMVLQEKNLVGVGESKRTLVRLSVEGKTYAEDGLPERRLMVALKELGGSAVFDMVVEKAGVDRQLVPIALGWVRRKKWADFEAQTGRLRVTDDLEDGADEKLIALLKKKGGVWLEGLSVELQDASKLLRGRRLVLVDEKTDRTVELTEAGRVAVKKGAGAASEVTQLTPELIVS